MHPILSGLLLGLSLAILVGPILFTIIQTSLEQGARAGLSVGLGIWVSDILYFSAVYWGLSVVEEMIRWPWFSLVVGVAGGMVLLGIGVGLALQQPPKVADHNVQVNVKSFFGHWLKGFLINTINPFTVFFWVSMMTTFVLPEEWGTGQAYQFFLSILGVIVLTDTLKVFLAKRIRNLLQYHHLLWTRRISGGILILFGIILIIRVMF